ncbi:outer membrane protein assembly factor BamD [Alphaproteobacteria bacterium]|jgi:outer membrane protein assembly factor BamD|nr:outer membrane protein assembly factor BamD [Alphaproteobacteria bacterium]MDB2583675.1 outer membrane protein assembly factor BamD [Alphaproteobacteria bacterium]
MLTKTSSYTLITRLISILFILVSCSNIENDKKQAIETDVDIYKRALLLIEENDYKSALNEFENLLLNYPFSDLAVKSEITSAYSLYEDNQIQKAINKLNSFIEMNPTGELTIYAHYLLGMCYYIQTSQKGRDASLSLKAINYFQIIESKYPNSKYAKDAKLKILYLKNRLAENELAVGKFYLKKNASGSAIKRFKVILEKFQNTSVIPETLYRLSEALLITGLKEEAQKSIAILNYNFPKNEWASLSKSLLVNNLNKDIDKGFAQKVKNYFTTIFN